MNYNQPISDKRIKYKLTTCFFYRAALMVFIWWILTDGDIGSLWVGLPAASAAAVVWCFLCSPAPFRIGALSLFSILFVWKSLQAGIDVALRVMRPNLKIDPAIINIPLHLPEGPSRILLSDTINLLPGTLTVKIAGDIIEVHVLDENDPVIERTRDLEKRVAAVFGHKII